MVRAAGIVGLSVLMLLAASAAVPGARAQTAEPEIVVAQSNNGVGGFFRRLFRREEPQPGQAPVFQVFPRDQQPPAAPRRERRNRAAAPSPREIAAVEKAEDARRVLVVGDFFGTALAKGLAVTYEENPNVLVIDATSGSSGLVRNDYYDWPGKLPGIVEQQKPDVILALVGGNDRQGIDTSSGPYALGTDGWRAAYAARVAALADAIKATGKPALWAGLVPVESSTMSRDYSSFNSIVREQLEGKGIPFVETWNGFADEDGKYVAVGPDVRGQSVQLRASDGLNFTRAGQRKLAFFLENDLEAIFGGTAPQLAAADPSSLKGGEQGPQIGPMVPLDSLAAAGGEELVTGAPGQLPQEKADDASEGPDAMAKRLAGEVAAPPGRADFYKWPPRPATPPAAEPEADAATGAAAAQPAPAGQ